MPIGHRFVLAPGFVNARTRHAEGPWYVPGKDLGARSSRVKEKRIVVTCRCGIDNTLSAGDEASRGYASGNPDERASRLES